MDDARSKICVTHLSQSLKKYETNNNTITTDTNFYTKYYWFYITIQGVLSTWHSKKISGLTNIGIKNKKLTGLTINETNNK